MPPEEIGCQQAEDDPEGGHAHRDPCEQVSSFCAKGTLSTHAAKRPCAAALREKVFGIWQTTTWEQLAAEVRAIACGLAEAGLKRGDHVVVVGENRPRLYASMLAIQLPPTVACGPKQCRRMPLSRERDSRLPQVFWPHLNSITRW